MGLQEDEACCLEGCLRHRLNDCVRMKTSLQADNRVVQRSWMVWVSSIAIFTMLGIALSVQTYYFNRSDGMHPVFLNILKRGLVSFWTYALLTPLVLWLCWRYPIERRRFFSRLLLHIVASLLFTAVNVSANVVLFPFKDGGKTMTRSKAWQSVFLYFLFDNTVNTYAPIAIVGHLMLYYRRFRERELRSAQLEGKLAQAQLSMLKMQLHPHFLFNTLHAISALTRDNPLAAEDMLARLSELLRQTLDSNAEQEVPLRAELDFLGRYLDIEQVRFADRLKVDIKPAQETLDALVPNMFLQPLVENALRHGIGRKTDGGLLEIRAWRDGDDCCVSVQDSGPGFVLVPRTGVNIEPAEGIGLSNTRSRLEHLYPGNHRLQLANASGSGAVVTIRIPFRTLTAGETPADEAIHI
jgi:two-component system LytT family sensor kinase